MRRKEHKQLLSQHKQEFKEVKKTFKLERKQSDSDRISAAKENLRTSKKQFKKTKQAFEKQHFTIKGAVKNKLKYKTKNKIHEQINKNEDLAEWNKQKQNAYRRSQMYNSLKKGSQAAARGGTKIIKSGYGLSNRTFNLVKGKGFRRTHTKVDDRLKKLLRYKIRLKKSRLAKGIGKTSRIFGKGVKVLNNPFKARAMVIILACLLPFILLTALFMPSVPKPSVVQSEVNLNETYLALTKLDAEHTDNINTFYTDWEVPIFYLNYRYDNFDPKSDKPLKDYYRKVKEEDRLTFSAISKKVWETINGSGAYKLTDFMKDIREVNSYWKMDSTDFEEFQESKNKIGFSVLSDRLGKLTDNESITISRRYGYERHRDSIKLNKETEIYLGSSSSVYSPLEGTLTEVGISRVVITQNNRLKFTISGITTERLTEGTTIKEGDLLGKGNSNIKITYEKMNKDKWYEVNPAFYFDNVSYMQTTTLGSSDFSPGSNKAARAKKIYDYFIKQGYTLEGIAAMLGNFDVESEINPKSAEGASPNTVVTDWDKPEFLNKNGIDIYGNNTMILKRGLGLGQWTDTADGSVRHTMLLDYAKSKNKKWYDLDLQLDFMMNGDTPSMVNILKAVLSKQAGDSVAELTTAFLKIWEGNPGDKLSKRIQHAQNWYNYFSAANAKSSVALNSDSADILKKYKDKMLKPFTDKEVMPGQGWEGNAYALGNCTWYVYNRMKQFGKTIYPYMQDAASWQYTYTMTEGATLADTPSPGDAVIFSQGVYGSHPSYGHVAFCEAVLEDGSIIISEMNWNGIYSMGYRILKPAPGMYYMHVEQ